MNIFAPQESSSPSGGTENTSLASQVGGSMGKDEFLQLLVTQLSNQDPMNPLDGHEFAAQLAQFTSVEQLINISDTLAANGEMNSVLAQSINSGVASGLIGKTVQASGNQIEWTGDGTSAMKFNLGGPAQNVTVTIRDAAGTPVRTLELGGRDAGEHIVEWDGVDKDGGTVPSGVYTYEVAAQDGSEDAVEVETFTRGNVDRITFGKDGILLWIGKISVSMQDVESVEQ